MLYTVYIIWCAVFLSEISARKNVLGQECFHKHKRMQGVCKAPAECNAYIEDLINGVSLEQCGRHEELCCVESIIGQKSQEMCKVYENITFVWTKEPTLLPVDELTRKSICPWENRGSTIIYGGEKAKPGEFPHMALIGYGKRRITWACGGSLISANFVLTAGHCLHLKGVGRPVLVRLGELNYTNPNDDMHIQDIPIKKFHKHPHYDYPSTYHDIALFELKYPAKLNVYVKPICIYTGQFLPAQVIATGWGDTENTSVSGDNSMLLKVGLDIYDSTTCSVTFHRSRQYPNGLNDSTQICAGSKERKDTCKGDSGGPIQMYNVDTDCSYYILGVTSNGKACGNKNIPAVYVRVYPYIQWIESIVWP